MAVKGQLLAMKATSENGKTLYWGIFIELLGYSFKIKHSNLAGFIYSNFQILFAAFYFFWERSTE